MSREYDQRRLDHARRQGMCHRCRVNPATATPTLCVRCHRNLAISRDRDRRLAIAHYGGKCACCGETEILFLHLDHVDGGGTKHRKSLGRDGTAFYRWLRLNDYPGDVRLQVMCANCNEGRHRNGGVCPHHTPRPKLAVYEVVVV